MAFRTKTATASRRVLKSGLNADDQRRKREDVTIALRKDKKEESLMKRRMQMSAPSGLSDEPVSQDNKALSSDEVNGLMQSTDQLLQAINSNDARQQLEAARAFRKLLSIERNPPIQHVIDTGVVPRLVSLLAPQNGVAIQFEAAWTLTNIASGSSQHTDCVLRHGAVPAFVALLQSPNADLAEQAVWALGNIAGDSTDCRDMLLNNNTMNGLLQLITPQAKTSLLRNVTWAISNLCRGKPRPDFDQIRPALRALAHLLTSKDDEIVTDAAWALSYISDDNAPGNMRIQAVVQEPGVVARLVQLLRNYNDKIQTPALRCIGNIVTGDDLQTQAVIQAGALPNVLGLMVSQKKGIRKEAAWTISNITAGSSQQIQAVLETGLIPPLVGLMANGEFDVQKEAAWALSNACSGGTADQVDQLVRCGLIQPLIALLTCHDPKIVMVALDGLDIILKHGKREERNAYHDLIEEANGLDVLEELQKHENEEVYEKTALILRSHFEEENNDEMGAAPSVSATGNQYVFNSAPAVSVGGGFNFSFA